MAVGAATRRSPTTDVGGELALSVTVYHPSSSLSEPMSRFLVLGRQPLTDLRDAIQCSSDRHGQALAKSGYFFIEGIFYNDMRCPGALDYSKNIIDWMHEQEGRQPLVARSMDGVRIDQLTIRLRCPYLYAHQGNCEHVLIFDSVRVVSGDMPRDAQDYPVVVFTTRPRHPGCYGCEKSPARWISYDDIHADRNPFMWCDHCFNHFHFNANGSASYQPLPHVEDLSTVPE
ncbi:snRNA-activating protein of 50kDa MW C terminal-domain-containing protein [Polychytrium aggregatum]|uniref:snRNA-activating protein of 50kDa MW C terminal-domain-containing protein n=1 Tax=Polychytrium aggregatum TaxID=110093 RepID=UPI0022FEA189|nr:snRNA-activating protein of 50kDa MW C terminal-domain-containing protein [Polychytrium aggregatum]KAI9206980.1 snRNA-activating protein of 50kDa MW C terminal-domain-containing protein [Polychytrium aggregatum]